MLLLSLYVSSFWLDPRSIARPNHLARSSTIPPTFPEINGLYREIGFVTLWVQTGAVLEIVHSLLGLVRSPFLTTFLQGKQDRQGFSCAAPNRQHCPLYPII